MASRDRLRGCRRERLVTDELKRKPPLETNDFFSTSGTLPRGLLPYEHERLRPDVTEDVDG